MNEYLVVLLTAWGAFSVACISPGPNMVAVAERGLASGRKAALLVALGIAIGALFWSAVTVFGLGELFAAFPWVLTVLGVVGGAYLLWLGIKAGRGLFNYSAAAMSPNASQGAFRDLLHGLTVTATNPKVALFWGSLSTFLVAQLPSAQFFALFAIGAASLGFLIYGAYGFVFTMPALRAGYMRRQRLFQAVFALVFCALGGMMIWRAVF